MSIRVFDASAVLAAIFEEPGVAKVTELWAEGDNWICSVNYAEVVSKLNERGMTDDEINIVLEGVPLLVINFEQAVAIASGLLRKSTKEIGLSLGDRACLAFGRLHDAEIVTAERLWKKLKGYSICLIR
jgi:ribonuclease VapC